MVKNKAAAFIRTTCRCAECHQEVPIKQSCPVCNNEIDGTGCWPKHAASRQ